MVEKTTILQIIGCLMKHPQYLSETDRYNLTIDDFSLRFDKFIFAAINSLYHDGAQRINPIDVENFLETNATASESFKKNNGIEYLQDADYLSDEATFDYYYKRLKKINLLTQLKKSGINTDKYYIEDITKPNALEVNKEFETLSVEDILDDIKKNILGIERNFIQNDATEVENVYFNISEIIDNANNGADVGLPVQGDIFNEVIAGARKGSLVVRSAGSGTGKTRQAVGDACFLAFPLRYDEASHKWIQLGSCKKVLFIATEQTRPEIQKMILAYLTGFNESKFRYGDFSNRELKILKQAMYILERYQENFYIVRMPNPSISLVKNIVRENVLLHDIEYVFYDYVFIGPSLLSEFKGISLRNDEILLMFATALKDLAVELNVFVMTATQVNANADQNTTIRNESTIAGSRAIINKADIGCVMARPTKQELDIIAESGIIDLPNCVTDIYKVRSGAWSQVRIWSNVNLGNLRKEDLFLTDARLEPIKDYQPMYNYNDSDIDKADIDEALEDIERIK